MTPSRAALHRASFSGGELDGKSVPQLPQPLEARGPDAAGQPPGRPPLGTPGPVTLVTDRTVRVLHGAEGHFGSGAVGGLPDIRQPSAGAAWCRNRMPALGGHERWGADRTAAMAFLVQAAGLGLGPAFATVVRMVASAGLSSARVERDVFGQPISDPDAGWPVRRQLVLDVLGALGQADEDAVPRQALAHALAGLAGVLRDGALLHGDQRKALRALLWQAPMRWTPERALAAGAGLGSERVDVLDGRSARPARQVLAPDAGPAGKPKAVSSGVERSCSALFALGLRAWDDLPGLLDETVLDDGSLDLVVGVRVQLEQEVPGRFGRCDFSRLLERLPDSGRSPSVQGRLALNVVRDLREAPPVPLFRLARNLILRRWGPVTVSSAPAPAWPLWQARHREAAQRLTLDPAGSPSGAKSMVRGERKGEAHVEAIDQLQSLYDAFEQRLRAGDAPQDLRHAGGLLAFLEEEIEQLMRMDGIPEPVRQCVVERLSVWGTQVALATGTGLDASSQVTRAGGGDE